METIAVQVHPLHPMLIRQHFMQQQQQQQQQSLTNDAVDASFVLRPSLAFDTAIVAKLAAAGVSAENNCELGL